MQTKYIEYYCYFGSVTVCATFFLCLLHIVFFDWALNMYEVLEIKYQKMYEEKNGELSGKMLNWTNVNACAYISYTDGKWNVRIYIAAILWIVSKNDYCTSNKLRFCKQAGLTLANMVH